MIICKEQSRYVVTYILHEDYDYLSFGRHDIALIKMNKPFDLNNYVQAIALPVINSIPSGNAEISGWGVTSINDCIANKLQVRFYYYHVEFFNKIKIF